MKSGDEAAFGKVPQLVKADGTATTSHKEQAEELLAKFFPPLPDNIENEGPRQERAPVTMPDLTLEESGTSTVGDKVREGVRRRWTTSDRLEAGLAVGETRRPRHFPSITG
jgi:hypothetical protein